MERLKRIWKGQASDEDTFLSLSRSFTGMATGCLVGYYTGGNGGARIAGICFCLLGFTTYTLYRRARRARR